MKRNIREIESNAVVVDKRLNRKIEEETQNVIRNFNGNLEEQRIEIENQMRLMQKLRARDKSDND
jgi:2,3-bisphosphoglycerate-independent phosphoglycerate mutase